MAGAPLVTGATGFAGSHLVDHLLEHVPRVSAWANPRGRPQGGDRNGRVTWMPVDLLDAPAVHAALGALRPDVIYHCAGAAHVGQSWSEPARALRVNVMGTHHLLEGARAARLTCSILVTGSAMVYRQSPEPIAEDHPLGPASPYGVSKLAQEMLALRAHELPVVVARPFNHAGPRQDDTFATSSFGLQIAEIEAGLREPVLQVGNLSARRDITDVRDVVRAYRLLVERGQPGRVYNVCSGHAYRVGDLLDALVGMSDVAIRVETDPARLRPSDNPIVLGDHSRVTAEVGWSPEIPIETTLRDLLAYCRERTAASTP